MCRRPTPLRLLSSLAILALAGAAPSPADWPQWMGAAGDGAVPEGEVFSDGAALELRERWRLPLGRGYSSVSVAGDRAYTLFADFGSEVLIAVDVRDGRELWRYGLDEGAGKRPLSTPAVAGGRVFAINSGGWLHAVDAADGTALWAHDLEAEFGARLPTYGVSTSPVLVDGLLVVLVGGAEQHNLVAFEPATGEIAWSVFHAGQPSYSSPVAGTLAGRRQIVVPAGDRLYAVRPEDGSLLWSHGDLGYPDRNPLLLPGDRIFLALQATAVMLRVEARGDALATTELWRTESLWFSYSPAVHLEGSIYGLGKDRLVCLDADTGAARWQHRLAEGSLILVGGHLLVLEQIQGSLHVVAADPTGFRKRASLRVFDPAPAFAPPSFADGVIFLRNHREMVAVDVGGGRAGR